MRRLAHHVPLRSALGVNSLRQVLHNSVRRVCCYQNADNLARLALLLTSKGFTLCGVARLTWTSLKAVCLHGNIDQPIRVKQQLKLQGFKSGIDLMGQSVEKVLKCNGHKFAVERLLKAPLLLNCYTMKWILTNNV